ncbi:MAG: phosphomevalonate kinase, partial [Microbacteriaceae bacterium]
LSELAGLQIETAELARLCETAELAGAAAKSSGAGGGDCGIVLADASTDLQALLRDWELNDIRRLSLDIHPKEESRR